jgi:hypothetical protein
MARSVEDYLIEGLSFNLNPGASYVTDRRSVSYFTAGSNIYHSGSGLVSSVSISPGEGRLDPSTVRLSYTLVNNEGTAAKILRPLSGPWSFFRRARCLVGGAIVDGIDYYNRVREMLHILTSKANRDNDSLEGFGARWDDDASWSTWNTEYGAIVDDVDYYNRVHETLHILTSEANRDNDELEGFGSRWDNDEFWGKWNGNTNFGEIPANGSRSVCFKPLFGLLNRPKYIPLMRSPLTLEFEVVNGATDPLVGRNASADYRDTNTSITWQLQDVRIVCDLVTLD